MNGNKTISFAQSIDPYIPTENLPSFRQDFDRATDPTTKKPNIETYKKDEDRGSDMVKSTQLQNLMEPPDYIRNPVLRHSFEQQWLAQQRKAIMAQASPQQNHKQDREQIHEPTKQRTYSR